MNDHQKHAARMQAAIEVKAARLKLKHALKSRSLEYINRAALASFRAEDKLTTAALPSAPVTYSTRWQSRIIPVTVEPTATLHTLIARTKAAHGLQNTPFPSPASAIKGSWTLQARQVQPPAFLVIEPADPLEMDEEGNYIL